MMRLSPLEKKRRNRMTKIMFMTLGFEKPRKNMAMRVSR